jgi:hypothetical protein
MKNLQYKNLYVIVTAQGFPDWTTLSYNKPACIAKFMETDVTYGRRNRKYQWPSLRTKFGYSCQKVDISIYPADGRPCKDDAAKKVGLCGK